MAKKASPLTPVNQAIRDIPFPEMLLSLGNGIAEAQMDMDMASSRLAMLMGGKSVDGIDPFFISVTKSTDPKKADTVGSSAEPKAGTKENKSLLQLGFTPSFYKFSEINLEVKMTISFSLSNSSSNRRITAATEGGFTTAAPWQAYTGYGEALSFHATASVTDEESMSKYSLKAEGISTMSAKIIPVKPPIGLMELLNPTPPA